MQLNRYFLTLGNFWKRHQHSLAASSIAFSMSIGVLGLRGAGGFQALDLKSLDYLFRLRPTESVDDRIVIVEISESDIQRQGKWPWSDRLFADLVDKISAAKPVSIGIDKILDLPSGEGRKELIAAIKAAGNVVNVTVLAETGKQGISLPQDLADVSQAGFANLPADSGSLIRRAILAVDEGSFPLLLAEMYLEKKANMPIKFDRELVRFSVGDRVIPRIRSNYGGYRNIDSSGYQVLINYRGKEGSFKHISAVDLLQGKIEPARLHDRIVLIGVTAISIKDSYPSPFSTEDEVMYGVEFHANIASQIISAGIDHRPFIDVWSEEWEAVWIILWTIAGGAISVLTRNVIINWLILTGLVLTLGGSVTFAFMLAWWLPFFPAVIGLVGANVLVTAYEFSQEQADRKLLTGLFSRHVSKELVDVIWAQREQFIKEGRIAGQEVYVTVLFTDMRNFSTFSEKQQPAETLILLNEYLGAIASVVLQHGGMVDKYIGDAVMAVFGVPIPHDLEQDRSKDAQNAVMAAVEAAKQLIEMNKHRIAQGLPQVVTGIGINSGMVIAGSLGSEERLEYSVLGDAVNVASRLESLNKEADGGAYHILISQETSRRLDDKFEIEFVGDFALKGREAETSVYRVLDVKDRTIKLLDEMN